MANLDNVTVVQHPLVRHKISLLRDQRVKPKQWRELVNEIGQIIGVQVTADFDLIETKDLTTPTGGTYKGLKIKDKVGLFPIMRAGLGMVDPFLHLLPAARVHHLGLYREKATLLPVEYYNKLPNECTIDVGIILDPMVATGGTAVAAINMLKDWGLKKIRLAAVIGSDFGIRAVQEAHPDVEIFVGAVDEVLNDSGYILPGCGDRKPSVPIRLDSLDKAGTVFSEFTGLAIKHNAVNLGQGFPTLPVPEFIRGAASKAIANVNPLHQYTRSEGHPRLVKALSKFYADKLGKEVNPMTEIITTVGATEAIYSTIQAFVNPGDEVILMQPFYDSYPASVTLAGGTPVIVTLAPGEVSATSDDWRLDLAELRRAVKPGKTKMIFVNNPHNPVGKVWRREELEGIANIAREFDLIVVADEVYETLVYTDSPTPMIKFASLPGMYERTITLGSIGKMFGVTGWKIGWCIAPPEITRSIWMVHQFLPFSVVTPLQEAAAQALEEAMASDYFEQTRNTYESLRNNLHALLLKNGLRPTMPHGGYFVMADTTSLEPLLPAIAAGSDVRRDFRVCRFLTTEVGVTPIPPSAFYERKPGAGGDVPGRFARFAFCKAQDLLDNASDRFAAYFKK
ncbi:Kynurenine--oxoglutarate transaminase 3 [Irineochytrium annulatum]|nr:Kynurenine--oxoglutarate transaminase 3 [Irineochytrium annulatum]